MKLILNFYKYFDKNYANNRILPKLCFKNYILGILQTWIFAQIIMIVVISHQENIIRATSNYTTFYYLAVV